MPLLVNPGRTRRWLPSLHATSLEPYDAYRVHGGNSMQLGGEQVSSRHLLGYRKTVVI